MRSQPLAGLLASLVSAFAFSVATTAPAQAAPVVFIRVIEPFTIDALHPCTGEPIELSGEVRITLQIVVDEGGGVHFRSQLVPSQIRGVAGGEVFKAVGGDREHINENAGDGLPITDTFTSTFNLISSGAGDNFLAHATFHITLNANGELTVFVVNDSAECRG